MKRPARKGRPFLCAHTTNLTPNATNARTSAPAGAACTLIKSFTGSATHRAASPQPRLRPFGPLGAKRRCRDRIVATFVSRATPRLRPPSLRLPPQPSAASAFQRPPHRRASLPRRLAPTALQGQPTIHSPSAHALSGWVMIGQSSAAGGMLPPIILTDHHVRSLSLSR